MRVKQDRFNHHPVNRKYHYQNLPRNAGFNLRVKDSPLLVYVTYNGRSFHPKAAFINRSNRSRQSIEPNVCETAYKTPDGILTTDEISQIDWRNTRKFRLYKMFEGEGEFFEEAVERAKRELGILEDYESKGIIWDFLGNGIIGPNILGKLSIRKPSSSTQKSP